MMDDAEAGITDPRRLARFDSFISRLAQIGQNSGKQFGLGELLETRRAINEFRSQGFGDYVATSRIDRVIANIDDQVVDATKVMPNGEAWLEQYRLANVEYAKMKTVEKNALYRALTAKGVTADKVVKELVTRIQSVDGTFMQVVGKLPMTTRNNVEGAVIRRLAENYSLGDASGYQAMDFPGLSVALKDVTFTTPAARDLKRVADKFASVYRNDPALSEAAGAVQLPKNTTYLATSIQSRADMAIHNKLFNYVSRYLPTQEGRTRRLAESMANVLDNPTNAAAIDDLVKAMPGDPELQTELKQLAISYAERGQKETYPKVPVYKVYTKGYSLASSTTDLGSGIQYFTNKADATAAKQTGQVLEEVLVEPSRYATPQQVEVLVGKPFSLDVAKDPRTIQILQRHNFLGIAESKRVLEFK
jgi:hypothetical protein